jgi:aconitate hydratase 2/2-methylisocitrate dehydratase
VLEAYREHVAERAAQNIPPKPLSADQVAGLVELLKNPPAGEGDFLLDLITTRVPPGVDEAAYVKAGFLSAIAKGEVECPLIDRLAAITLLGNMHGGYNIETLVELLTDADLGAQAAEELKHTLLMFDAFHDVAELAEKGNNNAKAAMQSWADGEWFTSQDAVAESIKVAVFKVTGETNTDDLSPAPDAWSRPDIPLHALAMYKMTRDGLEPEEHGVTGPMKQVEDIQNKGLPVAFVGDVVGTGSSRKSATNSVLWRAQQTRWWYLHRRQSSPDFLQHHGGRGRTGI